MFDGDSFDWDAQQKLQTVFNPGVSRGLADGDALRPSRAARFEPKPSGRLLDIPEVIPAWENITSSNSAWEDSMQVDPTWENPTLGDSAWEGLMSNGPAWEGRVPSDRPSVVHPLDLRDMQLRMPPLTERWEGPFRQLDLMPEARPVFILDERPVDGMYSGIDYLLSYYSVARNAEGERAKLSPVASIVRAGVYCVVVEGVSDRLIGTARSMFVVEKANRLRQGMRHWHSGS